VNKIVPLFLGSLVLGTAFASAADAAEGWARSSARLRAGPGTSYPAITRVAAGEALDVHGCLRSWSWCDVSVGGERGWFPGSRIALPREGRRVALPGVAALFGLGIVGFERDVYWRDHYRERRFYERHDRERRDRPGGYDRPDRPDWSDRPVRRDGPERHEGRRPDRDPPRMAPPPRVEAPPRRDVRPPIGEVTHPRPHRPDPGEGARPFRPPTDRAERPQQMRPTCPPGAPACR
jgi:uncharacterized protein YraI